MRHLSELFLAFILWMALTDGYIYRRFIKSCKNLWPKLLYGLPGFLLLTGMGFMYFSYEPRPQAMSHLGLFLVLFLCIHVPKTLFILTYLCLKRWTIALAVALFSMAYFIFGATEGKQHFQVKEVCIESEDLPEGFDGYRIVQFADFHAGSWGENTDAIRKAVNIINGLHPDLIVFTGDLINNLANEVDGFMPILSQLNAPDGVYSVLGNHDYSTYIKWQHPSEQEEQLVRLKQKQAEMGWTLLNNRHVKLYQQTDSIALIGVENSGHPPFPDHAKLTEAMTGTEGMFRILLSHDPSHWRREVLPKTDIQLMLAGHTHAMQTKVFGFTPSRFIYPECDGLYQEGAQQLYVNIGLGHLLYPMRLGAWPEITLLTLRKSNIP